MKDELMSWMSTCAEYRMPVRNTHLSVPRVNHQMNPLRSTGMEITPVATLDWDIIPGDIVMRTRHSTCKQPG
jgi:hypothetical protein